MSKSKRKRDVAAEQRILKAFEEGADWKVVAKHNGVAATTAWRLVQRGSVDHKPRGGARASTTKVTFEIAEAIKGYIDDDSTLTLSEISNMVFTDYNVQLSVSTVSRYLTRAPKKIRVEPSSTTN